MTLLCGLLAPLYCKNRILFDDRTEQSGGRVGREIADFYNTEVGAVRNLARKAVGMSGGSGPGVQ